MSDMPNQMRQPPQPTPATPQPNQYARPPVMAGPPQYAGLLAPSAAERVRLAAQRRAEV